MLIKDVQNCQPFVAGDGSVLNELLNPLKEALNIRYSLAHATVRPGQKTLAHRLKSAEVYYILSGAGEVCIGQERGRVVSGQAIYIPPDSLQWIRNIGREDLVFLCIVDPAWRPEDEEVIETDEPG